MFVFPDQDLAPLTQENQRELESYVVVVINFVSKLPLFVSDSIKSVKKTKETIKVLMQIGAFPNIEKEKDNHNIREIQNCSNFCS